MLPLWETEQSIQVASEGFPTTSCESTMISTTTKILKNLGSNILLSY